MSLIVGVIAVVGVFTVGTITRDVFVASAEQLHGRQATYAAPLTDAVLTPASLDHMLAVSHALAPRGGAAAIVVASRDLTGLQIAPAGPALTAFSSMPFTLVAGDYRRVWRVPLRDGRWLDTAGLPIEVVLNEPAAQEWGGPGTTVRLLVRQDTPAVDAVVVGVVNDGQESPGGYASLDSFVALWPGWTGANEPTIFVHQPDKDLKQAVSVASAMAMSAGTSISDADVTRVDTVEGMANNLEAQRTAFLAIAALALAVSALGILNIGLASMAERARELVIRRAIGATRLAITSQVLIGAVLLGVASAAVAVGLVVIAMQWWVPTQIPPQSALEPPGVPWNAVAWGVGASVMTTLLGSAIPAVVAGRFDVAQVLRA